MRIDLRQGDCLELMKDIPDSSIDLTFCSKKSLTSKVGDELRLLMLE